MSEALPGRVYLIMSVKIKNQMHVDCFFVCLWPCSYEYFSERSDSDSHILHLGAKTFTGMYLASFTHFVEKQIVDFVPQ